MHRHVFLFAVLLIVGAAAPAALAGCKACQSYGAGSQCSTFDGPIPDCTTVCSGYYCSCQRNVWAECRWSERSERYFYVKIQQARVVPADRPFDAQYIVARVAVRTQPVLSRDHRPSA